VIPPARYPIVIAALAAGAIAVTPRCTGAQESGARLVERAFAAYEQLDLATTVGLLQRALGDPDDASISRKDRLRAFTVLGAAQLLRDQRDSAASVFRELVLLAPRYRPDALLFPPPVLDLFTTVRGSTRAVALEAPDSARLKPGVDKYRVSAFASSTHEMSATIARSDGPFIRQLYRGPIGDSLWLEWDGLDSAGAMVPTGTYLLRVESYSTEGRVLRLVQAPLGVETVWPDTSPHPVLPNAALKPERVSMGPALGSLLAGAGVAAAAILMPGVMGDDGSATDARLVVGGVLGITSVVGFFTHQPGRPLPQNREANRAVRAVFEEELSKVLEQNAAMLEHVRIVVRSQAPVRIDREGR
jgi:hypothetical protein